MQITKAILQQSHAQSRLDMNPVEHLTVLKAVFFTLVTSPRSVLQRKCADAIGTVLVPWAGPISNDEI